MNNPFKKPNFPKLTPTKRLILTLWTLVVVMLTLYFFRKLGPRVLLAALILVPLIFGVLLGLRWLDRFDQIARRFGLGAAEPVAGKTAEPPADKAFDAFLAFLKRHRSQGQFTRTELQRFCNENALQEETLIRIGRKKGWFSEMGGAFVITSAGEEMLQKFA